MSREIDPRALEREQAEPTRGGRGGASPLDGEATATGLDPLTVELDLPRGPSRERVHALGRDYWLSGRDVETLAAVGAFRVVPSHTLHPAPARTPRRPPARRPQPSAHGPPPPAWRRWSSRRRPAPHAPAGRPVPVRRTRGPGCAGAGRHRVRTALPWRGSAAAGRRVTAGPARRPAGAPVPAPGRSHAVGCAGCAAAPAPGHPDAAQTSVRRPSGRPSGVRPPGRDGT